MARAGVQHDLYFPSSSRPYVDIFGGSTLGFIWSNVILASYARRRSVPWIDRNFERLLQVLQGWTRVRRRTDGFGTLAHDSRRGMA
jgi:hypothetical protein